MTPDEERLNLVCIIGLITIAVILVVGILVLSAMKVAVSDALVVMASGVTGGLAGYLGSHSKKGTASNVDASRADVVNVSTEPAEPPAP